MGREALGSKTSVMTFQVGNEWTSIFTFVCILLSVFFYDVYIRYDTFWTSIFTIDMIHLLEKRDG